MRAKGVSRTVLGLILASALWFLARPCAYAQTTGSEIDVTVTDSSGAVVPGAKVVVRGSTTGNIVRSVVTNSSGFAAVPLLKPDAYDVSVDKSGFQQLVHTNVVLNVGAVVHLHLSLKVGNTKQAVTVMGKAPLVNTTTGSVGQVVTNSTMEQLPLNGRNYTELGLLAAGTAPPATGGGQGVFSAYGLRAIANEFMLDGAVNESYMRGFDIKQRDAMRPSLESIQEFKVQTGNYSAQYGSAAGAVITAVTKSGTNRIHGSAFDFLRNDALDARNYFAAVGAKPKLIRNQFGGSLGGPIKKDKAWYFGAYQGTKIITDNVFLATVPSADMKQGIFGSTPIYDPNTTTANPSGSGYVRTQFTNNTIPSTMFDPIGLKLVQLYPDPNLPGAANNYETTAPDTTNVNNATFRGDVQLTSRSSMFARLSFNLLTRSTQPALPPPAQPNVNRSEREWSIGYGFTHTFSPTLINEFRFGWNRLYLNKDTPLARDEIIPNALAANVDGTPIFSPSGYMALGGLTANFGGALPTTRISGVFDFSDNLSKIVGTHSIKMGFDYLYARISDLTINTGLARGSFGFNGTYTDNPQHPSGTGSAIADLLLGLAQTAQTGTTLDSNERSHAMSGYFQDDWSATSRLTFNLGVRYDLYFPLTEVDNKMANFIIDPANPDFGHLIYAGLDGHSRSLMAVDKNNVAPRFGFAYRVPHIHNFVIRGGYGVFFGNPDGNQGVVERMVNNPPFVGVGGVSLIGDQVFPSTAFSLSNGTLPQPPPPPSPQNYVLDPTSTGRLSAWPGVYTSPYVQEWNFTLEKALPWNVSWEVNYVGNAGTHLWGNYEGNQPMPGPGGVNPRRPLAQYTRRSIFVVSPWARSHYEGISTRLQKRMSNGLYFLASYTHGKAMDMMSSPATGYTANISAVPNSYDRNAMMALADSDVPNRFVLSSIWQLPFGPNRAFLTSGWGEKIAGNWDVSGIWQAQDGRPFTLRTRTQVSNVGNITYPDRVCNGALPNPTIQLWYDPSCFPDPARYTFGNSGRNVLFGPGTNNVDFSVDRLFNLPIHEGTRLEFRAEFYNLFNHPEFDQPGAVLDLPATGSISGTKIDNRTIELAMKITW